VTKTVPADQVQTHLLDLLDEVSEKHAEFVITKDGEPIARVVPIDRPDRGPMFGTATILGDIVEPLDEEWEANE
jgi:prevent-host-death family protein